MSMATQKFSPLEKGNTCDSGIKTPRVVDQDPKAVKNRIFEKKVHENRLSEMFSKRSKTP